MILTRFFAEEQSRYLVAGHSKQWPEAWHQIPKPGFIEEELVKKVQHALSYVHVVGNTKRLDAVVDKVCTTPYNPNPNPNPNPKVPTLTALTPT